MFAWFLSRILRILIQLETPLWQQVGRAQCADLEGCNVGVGIEHDKLGKRFYGQQSHYRDSHIIEISIAAAGAEVSRSGCSNRRSGFRGGSDCSTAGFELVQQLLLTLL